MSSSWSGTSWQRRLALLTLCALLTGCTGSDQVARPAPAASSAPPGAVTSVLTPLHAGPSTAALTEAAATLRARLKTAGINQVDVSVNGSTVVVRAAAAVSPRLPLLSGRGRLELRQVLECSAMGEGYGCSPLPAEQQPPGPAGATASAFQGGAAYGAEAFAGLNCAIAAARAGDAADLPGREVIACAKDGTEKFHLGLAKVVRSDIQSATVSTDQLGVEPLINVTFTIAGQRRWTALSVDACGSATAANGNCPNAGTPRNRVAIVLDGLVYSSPSINEPIKGAAQIAGNFTQTEAQDMVSVLSTDPLPFGFSISAKP